MSQRELEKLQMEDVTLTETQKKLHCLVRIHLQAPAAAASCC